MEQADAKLKGQEMSFMSILYNHYGVRGRNKEKVVVPENQIVVAIVQMYSTVPE